MKNKNSLLTVICMIGGIGACVYAYTMQEKLAKANETISRYTQDSISSQQQLAAIKADTLVKKKRRNHVEDSTRQRKIFEFKADLKNADDIVKDQQTTLVELDRARKAFYGVGAALLLIGGIFYAMKKRNES